MIIFILQDLSSEQIVNYCYFTNGSRGMELDISVLILQLSVKSG